MFSNIVNYSPLNDCEHSDYFSYYLHQEYLCICVCQEEHEGKGNFLCSQLFLQRLFQSWTWGGGGSRRKLKIQSPLFLCMENSRSFGKWRMFNFSKLCMLFHLEYLYLLYLRGGGGWCIFFYYCVLGNPLMLCELSHPQFCSRIPHFF